MSLTPPPDARHNLGRAGRADQANHEFVAHGKHLRVSLVKWHFLTRSLLVGPRPFVRGRVLLVLAWLRRILPVTLAPLLLAMLLLRRRVGRRRRHRRLIR